MRPSTRTTVCATLPADGEVGLLHRARAADVGHVQRDADDELAQTLDGLGRRHGVEDVAGEDLLLDVALHVDDRRRTGDGNGFLQGANRQLDIDGGGEVGSQLHTLPRDGVEAREAVGERVGAGPEIDDAVDAVLVRHRSADLLDEDRAGRLNRDSGHDGA
jgi:hypothetical protein